MITRVTVDGTAAGEGVSAEIGADEVLAGEPLAGPGTGVSKKERGRLLKVPSPMIWPRSLMAMATVSCQPEFAGIRVFRSTTCPFIHKAA